MKPIIIAHRGASGYAPENTMAAFRLAVDQGADGIELDLRQTADGHLVVLHDATLERTGGNPRPVSALTLQEIHKLDVGAWRGPEFRGEKMPTLETVLQFTRNRIALLIELKNGSSVYPAIEKRLFDLLKQNPSGLKVTVSSFDLAALKTLRGLDDDLQLGLLTKKNKPTEILKDAESLNIQGLHLSTRRLSREILEQAHARQLPVYAYTVNTRSQMTHYLDMGLDGLFTDYPDRLKALLAGR